MTRMFFRSALVLTALAAAGVAVAAQQPRYIPAPSGKPYLMFAAHGAGLSTFETSEKVDIAEPGPFEYEMTSSWGATWGELGLTAGYGTGSLWLP